MTLLQKYHRNPRNLVVVDVRTEAERAVSVIKGAVTKEQYEADVNGEYVGKKIVAYCTIGYRSGKYVEKLIKDKGVDAYNLRGSILAWTHAGGRFGDCRRDTHERGSHVGQGVGAAEERPRGGVLRPTGGGVRQEGARVGEVTRHQIYFLARISKLQPHVWTRSASRTMLYRCDASSRTPASDTRVASSASGSLDAAWCDEAGTNGAG